METINKSELEKALVTVKPGLANNEVIEQSTSFCFVDGHVVTYNDEISIRYPVDIELEGAVNAKELYGFVNKVSSEELNMEIEGSELILKAGRAKASLTLQSEILLPIEEIGKIKDWTKLPKGFWKAVDFARASCSTDMSRAVLTCVHVNGAIVEGTDNLRVTKTELYDEVEIPEFLFPAKLAGIVSSLRPAYIAEGKGWIHFKTKEEAIISCRIFEEDKYVDTDKVWGVDGDTVKFPEQMLDILERAEVFAKRENSIDEAVSIELQNKKLIVRSESMSGKFEEKARVQYDGQPINFSVTLYLLKDILKETEKATISDKMLLFQGDNWKYLTMLRG
jgi:DNA polymerase III sliding clamp (beta) subunit (PCNA family)